MKNLRKEITKNNRDEKNIWSKLFYFDKINKIMMFKIIIKILIMIMILNFIFNGKIFNHFNPTTTT